MSTFTVSSGYGGALLGGPPQLIDSDEPDTGQGDGTSSAWSAVSLRCALVIQERAHAAGQFIGAFGFLNSDVHQGQRGCPLMLVDESRGLTLRIRRPEVR